MAREGVLPAVAAVLYPEPNVGKEVQEKEKDKVRAQRTPRHGLRVCHPGSGEGWGSSTGKEKQGRANMGS
jgi:hypothetical protein